MKNEAKYLGALERLIQGRPNHPDLKLKVACGSLRISIRAVAKEAGLSHAPISKGNYPLVSERLEEHVNRKSRRKRLRKGQIEIAAELKEARASVVKMATKIAFLESKCRLLEMSIKGGGRTNSHPSAS